MIMSKLAFSASTGFSSSRGLASTALCLLLTLAAVVLADAGHLCSSAGSSCSLAGTCGANSTCICDAGFKGPHCEALDLDDNSSSVVIAGLGPGAAGVIVNRTLVKTVWGGHLAFDEFGYSRWFGSAILNGKSLDAWATQSAIAVSKRAPASFSSASTLTPFEIESFIRRGDEQPSSAWDSGSLHGVYVTRNPKPYPSGEDTWLIFYTGMARHEPLGSRKIGVLYGPSLDGPWMAWPQPVFGPSKAAGDLDSSSVSNPAPAFYMDGSGKLILAYKGLGHPTRQHGVCEDGSGKPCIFFARADHWKGPYRRYSNQVNPAFKNAEDPSLWQDRHGNWHMVFEKYMRSASKPWPVTAHAYSKNGLTDWTVTPWRYWRRAETAIRGKVVQLSKLERPQVVLDIKTREPRALFQGACFHGCCTNIVTVFAPFYNSSRSALMRADWLELIDES